MARNQPQNEIQNQNQSSGSSASSASSVAVAEKGKSASLCLKKGPWTSSEDAILVEYVKKHGEGNWNAVQKYSGLYRCGKSCRLRWANHLRPNLRKGAFTPEEERLILELHAKLGNKWARMAAQLPGRTDNEIKNYWNTRIKRRQRAGLPLYPPDIEHQNHRQNERSHIVQSTDTFRQNSWPKASNQNNLNTFDAHNERHISPFCSSNDISAIHHQSYGLISHFKEGGTRATGFLKSLPTSASHSYPLQQQLPDSFPSQMFPFPSDITEVSAITRLGNQEHINANANFNGISLPPPPSMPFLGALKLELPSIQATKSLQVYSSSLPNPSMMVSATPSLPSQVPTHASSGVSSYNNSGLLEALLQEAQTMAAVKIPCDSSPTSSDFQGSSSCSSSNPIENILPIQGKVSGSVSNNPATSLNDSAFLMLNETALPQCATTFLNEPASSRSTIVAGLPTKSQGIVEMERFSRVLVVPALVLIVGCFSNPVQCRRLPSGTGSGARKVFSVDAFGAKGNGKQDDSQAFLKAWDAACKSSSRKSLVMDVPAGKEYLLQPLAFKGPCKHRIVFRIAGTIKAPATRSDWDHVDGKSWLQFDYIENTTINGGGTIEGNGQSFWDCKQAGHSQCQTNPNTLTINFGKNVRVRNLFVRNSPQAHIVVYASTGVDISRVKLESPDESPNTDGVLIGFSQNVAITSSWLGVGDDCVAIVSGNSDIYVRNVRCGPGHGISVGSLGQDNEKVLPVTNVTVIDSKFINSTNGVRIKTWQGGKGEANNILFEKLTMDSVNIPINIDQFYCPATGCSNQTSAVRLRDVTFRDIKGTASSEQAIKLACSSSIPCTNIVLQNINLSSTVKSTRPSKRAVSTSTVVCNNVYGTILGTVNPPLNCVKAS